ncbi:hypothetical protein G7B40_003965 [Aetokthonos hydrillicola Thurmond2011]|jgi:hypothetical protein|uniref:Uncharacterized protein n=1 Tax=Aetokthonos hydrillicola Thurmond2011 TaxID=2712845 RepID=A0AAP5M8X1_9CYAN|nr:hypothetical protein [Aetokthonos hydrillicola]MBO3457439.1 DUF1190 domain-containing protein [Aetokthonos hydrillicola CCALA 1050]MBW4586040.1 hypothetical protein [Aetokthonos hydrillicola CCALA 1050]MDR9893734.1 hypothetical protein [Aetokthonos hydrillicola Thurmond2011]
MFMTLLRKFTVIVLALSLCLTTVACGGGGNQTTPQGRNVSQTTPTKLSDGQYPVQQASYDDGNGEYTLFLLNSPSPTFRTQSLQMARLTDEQIKQGQKSFLKVEKGQPILYLTEDFKIEYVHNVAETKTNPQTGQQETVVARRESGFWAPFAGALAGQAIGSLLFRPQYYVPPAYQPGGGSLLTGYGGYGRSYNDAIASYQTRYNAPPAEVRNRTTFRSTGTIRRSYPDNTSTRTIPPTTTNRPTGSGFGSSTLRPSGDSSSIRRPSSGSFGSGGRSRVPRGGFGSRRR